MKNTAQIIERDRGWAIRVDVNGKAGFIGKTFKGVTIYASFGEARSAAIERGYTVVNQANGTPVLKGGDEHDR